MSAIWRLALVGALSLVLMIPLAMVRGLVQERAQLKWHAEQAIEQRWSRAQTVTGPMLRVPVEQWRETNNGRRLFKSFRLLLPDELKAEASLDVAQRYYGIYQTPVYTAQLKFTGHFEPDSWVGIEGDVRWSEAQLVLPLSDVRGLQAATVAAGGIARELAPIPLTGRLRNAVGFSLDLLSAPGALRSEIVAFDFELALAGTKSLQFIPIGKQNQFSLQGNWGDPSFVGAYLPLQRQVDDDVFSASWRVLGLNRGFGQIVQDQDEATGLLMGAAFGVELFQPAGIYQQSERAVKYGMLFVALTFMGLFIFEALSRTRLHPVQYLLLGLALCTFYIVLLALSEHTGFGWAYLLAATALVGMIGGYTMAILPQRRQGIVCGGLLAGVYVLLYWLLISESYSLLVGALALLGMLGAIMYLTRQVDWFDLRTPVVRLNRSAASPLVD